MTVNPTSGQWFLDDQVPVVSIKMRGVKHVTGPARGQLVTIGTVSKSKALGQAWRANAALFLNARETLRALVIARSMLQSCADAAKHGIIPEFSIGAFAALRTMDDCISASKGEEPCKPS